MKHTCKVSISYDDILKKAGLDPELAVITGFESTEFNGGITFTIKSIVPKEGVTVETKSNSGVRIKKLDILNEKKDEADFDKFMIKLDESLKGMGMGFKLS